MSEGTKRKITAIVLLLFLAVNIMSGVFLYAPKKASAQICPFCAIGPWGKAADVPGVLETIGKTIADIAVMAFLSVVNNLITMTLQQLAYDLAEAAATGSPGQGSVFAQDGWSNFGDKVAGEAFGSLNESLNLATGGGLQKLGLDLCNPDPQLLLNIQLGLAVEGKFTRPEPQCDWNDIKSNWGSLKDEMNNGEILKRIGASFDISNSDMGIALGINESIITGIDKETTAAINERMEGQGWLPVKEVISGDIKTPAQMAKKELSKGGDLADMSMDAQIEALTNNMSLKNYAVLALSVFTNTFLSKSLETLMSGIISPYTGKDISLENAEQDASSSNKKAVQENFNSFNEMKRSEVPDYDLLSIFSTCPSNNERGVNNCVMDSNFAAAVRQADSGEPLTVKEAVDAGLLDPDGIFGYSIAKYGIEPDYKQGFGYSNIQKMRLAMILPLGWEIAASEVKRLQTVDPSAQFTLGEMLDGFDDKSSSFYHLVDPNWVLKFPEAKCRMLASGVTLANTQLNEREEICVDLQHCLEENEDGICQDVWGYCVKESNFWRFDGDRCPAQYNTCAVFGNKDGDELSILENTIDPGICDAANAGCEWYSPAKERHVDTEGNISWEWVDPQALDGYDRLYFNGKIKDEPCDEKNEGCSKFIDGEKANYNYIKNPSFEDGSNVPESWSGNASFSAETYNLDRALQAPTSLSQSVDMKKADGNEFVFSILSKGCSSSDEAAIGSKTIPLAVSDNNNEWHISEYAFVSASQSANVIIQISSSSCLIDAAQIEEGTEASAYHEGYDVQDAIFMKKAPDYYQCQGYTRPISDFDNEEDCEQARLFWRNDITECVQSGDDNCSRFALYCDKNEVSCSFYKPKNGEKVPGIVGEGDLCPKECVGYKTYKQEETNFEMEKPAVDLIPTAEAGAAVCSKEYAGCDEFTNESNNEELEYYSYLRECIQPDDIDKETGQKASCGSFYTWAGSEETGYRLENFYLKYDAGDGESGDIYKNDPAVTKSDSSECNEAIYKSGIEPDCRQFYNSSGEVSYHLYTRTITCSEECSSLRKTNLDTDPAMQGSSDCSKKNVDTNNDGILEDSEQLWHWKTDPGACVFCPGRYWDSTEECIYRGLPAEAVSCPANMNLCREYKGTSSGNRNVVFDDSFESGDVGTWKKEGYISMKNSPEAVNPSQHSLYISPGSGTAVRQLQMNADITPGRTYYVSFWAKSPLGSNLNLGLGQAKFNAALALDSGSVEEKLYFNYTDDPRQPQNNVNITPVWREYNLGPLVADWEGAEGLSGSYSPIIFLRGGGNELFIDHIRLEEVPNSLYLIKDSWTIPKACDDPYIGAHLGCEEYANQTEGGTYYIRSFSKLCRDEVVGCRDLIDTYNTDQRQSLTFNGQENDQSTFSIPEDDHIYLVDAKDKRCDSKEKGCMAAGLPGRFEPITGEMRTCSLYSTCQNPEGCPCQVGEQDICIVDKGESSCRMSTVYIKNDPENYDTLLCTEEALGCEEYKKDDGSRFFKDPGDKICVYDDQKGWIKKYKVCEGGPNDNKLCMSGDDCGGGVCQAEACAIDSSGSPDKDVDSKIRIYKKTLPEDPEYEGWVGECPQEYNMCAKFIDPAGTSLENLDACGNPQEQAYYYIYNDKLKAREEQCQDLGGVSLKEGCVLFNKQSVGAEMKYNSEATYQDSESKEFNIVEPSKSGSLDTNIYLKVVRDRKCSEWITGTDYVKVYDPQVGDFRNVYYELAMCNKLDPDIKGECAKFLEDPIKYPELEKIIGIENSPGYNPSDYINYRNREISWGKGYDYTGYSLFNKRPITAMEEVKFGKEDDDPFVLTYVPGREKTETLDQVKSIDRGAANNSCSTSDDCPAGMACYDNGTAKHCVFLKSCRGYPMSAAPFPSDISPQYGKYTNLCQDGKNNINGTDQSVSKCDCDFTEVTAQGISGYFEPDSPVSFIKTEGVWGQRCDDPTQEGCSSADRIIQYKGWRGYCLEEDQSRAAGNPDSHACITWLPKDLVNGEVNVFADAPEAGLNIDQNLDYCVGSMRYENRRNNSSGQCEANPCLWNFLFPPGNYVAVLACGLAQEMGKFTGLFPGLFIDPVPLPSMPSSFITSAVEKGLNFFTTPRGDVDNNYRYKIDVCWWWFPPIPYGMTTYIEQDKQGNGPYDNNKDNKRSIWFRDENPDPQAPIVAHEVSAMLCSEVVRAAKSNDNKIWSNRLWPGSEYYREAGLAEKADFCGEAGALPKVSMPPADQYPASLLTGKAFISPPIDGLIAKDQQKEVEKAMKEKGQEPFSYEKVMMCQYSGDSGIAYDQTDEKIAIRHGYIYKETWNLNEDLADKSNLKNLFAKSYASWKWENYWPEETIPGVCQYGAGKDSSCTDDKQCGAVGGNCKYNVCKSVLLNPNGDPDNGVPPGRYMVECAWKALTKNCADPVYDWKNICCNVKQGQTCSQGGSSCKADKNGCCDIYTVISYTWKYCDDHLNGWGWTCPRGNYTCAPDPDNPNEYMFDIRDSADKLQKSVPYQFCQGISSCVGAEDCYFDAKDPSKQNPPVPTDYYACGNFCATGKLGESCSVPSECNVTAAQNHCLGAATSTKANEYGACIKEAGTGKCSSNAGNPGTDCNKDGDCQPSSDGTLVACVKQGGGRCYNSDPNGDYGDRKCDTDLNCLPLFGSLDSYVLTGSDKEPNKTNDSLVWDYTHEAGIPPRVYSVKYSELSLEDWHQAGKENSLTMGTFDDRDAIITRGDKLKLSFYAYNANGEQMPMRGIEIDWGDNKQQSWSGGGALASYKNFKQECTRVCKEIEYEGTGGYACKPASGLIDNPVERCDFGYCYMGICTEKTADGVTISCKNKDGKDDNSLCQKGECSLDENGKEICRKVNIVTSQTAEKGGQDISCGNDEFYLKPGEESLECNFGRCLADGTCAGNRDVECGKDEDCDKGYCRSDNFGDSGDACNELPWEFVHRYSDCTSGMPGWTSSCPVAGVDGGCCLFKPKVMVSDNWDWCSGSCEKIKVCSDTQNRCKENKDCESGQCGGKGFEITGCYKDACKDKKKWVAFGARVIVLPDYEQLMCQKINKK